VRPSVLRKAITTGVALPGTVGIRARAISALTAYKTCPTSPTKKSAFSLCKVLKVLLRYSVLHLAMYTLNIKFTTILSIFGNNFCSHFL